MFRFARVAALLALVTALCSRAFAGAPAGWAGGLDPARMFDPAADSLFAGVLSAPKYLSPMSVALFNEPNPQVIVMAPRIPAAASGTATVGAIVLQRYVPAAPVASAPVAQPSVAPAAQMQHLQISQAAVPRVHLAAGTEPAVHFGAYAPYTPALQALKEDVQVPVRIGGVHFAGVVSGGQEQTSRSDAVRAMQLCGTTDEAAACPYLHDERTQTLAAGTAFNVRAGNTQVNLQLSGSVGRVSNGDAAIFQYTPLAADPQFDAIRAGSPDDTSLLYYPGLTEMVQHGLNARIAVPVSPAITVGLQYDRAHYQGDYGDLLAPGVDATKDTYLGNVTYRLPNSSSMLTLSARQYRYQDSFAPNFNLTETRADLSFTVKF